MAMTTKFKIIGGFVVMILLLAGMAGLGYYDIEQVSNGFVSYRRQARVNVAASDMVTNIAQSVSKTYDYVSTRNAELIKNAHEDIDQFIQIADTAMSETSLEYRKQTIGDLKKQVAPLKGIETNIMQNLNALVKEYNETVRPSYNKMAELIKTLASQAHAQGNADALRAISDVWDGYADFIGPLSRYAMAYSQEEGELTSKRLETLSGHLKALERQLSTNEGNRILAEITAAHKVVQDALASMRTQGQSVRASLAQMHALENEITKAVTDFNDRVDGEMRAEGTALLASNEAGQKIMLTGSIAGIIIGMLLAVFIIVGIVRVLNDLAHFAGAIAKGDFGFEVRSREKGEIGAMVNSMKAIPATLNDVLEEYTTLEHHIENGKLTAQGDVEKFHGGFATLIRGTNAILGRFLTVLESIPSPVVMLDKDQKAAYINTVARDLAGSAYAGKTCFELFAREDFGSDKDALKKAMETKRPASGETRAHPQGKAMDVAYNAIPMVNSQGHISSILQLITDLTPIKEQQRTMLDVAARASDISSRVAAASEELSAQVEQVSRGAEMQRERVESTASAMTEMNATVLEVAKSAGEASDQSDMTRGKADDGAKLVNQVVNAINMVNTVAIKLQDNMQELGRQAESIDGVMSVISDIADQTNLLALNAAIEAARAGEAGRGFAVVADSVRQLAEKTMAATDEVGTNIRAIQESARSNIEGMTAAVKNVHDATDLANSSGQALSEIVNLASASSAVVASIATAAEEQSATSEEISRAIDEISQVVNETAQGMIESSAAVQDLSRMAQELRHVMESLK